MSRSAFLQEPVWRGARDVLYLLEGEGIDTGISVERLITVADWVVSLLGTELPGLVHRAGPRPTVATP